MFWRIVKGALFRQKGKMVLIAFTVALGASLATSMLNTMLGVGDKVNQELKTYGANINVLPKEASLLDDLYGMQEKEGQVQKYLKESELPNIKTIFWAYNIVDYTPYLNTWVSCNNDSKHTKMVGTWFNNHMDLPTGESVDTGMIRLKNWWEVQGEWLSENDSDSVMLGKIFADRNGFKVGDEIQLKSTNLDKKLKVKGIFSSGSDEDAFIYATLKTAQEFAGVTGVVNKVEVSALTTPDNDLARKAAKTHYL